MLVGYYTQALIQDEMQEGIKMKRNGMLAQSVIIFVLMFIAVFPASAEDLQWLGNVSDIEALVSTLWEFDRGQIGEDEFILSVSPSGQYILAMDRGEMNISGNVRTAKNNLGMKIGHISLYRNQNGVYVPAGRISIDIDTEFELNETVATCGVDGVAWIGEEPRLLLTTGVNGFSGAYGRADAAIYLVDFVELSTVNLTGDASGQENAARRIADLMPTCMDGVSAHFIRYEMDDKEIWKTSLMRLNLKTGEQQLVADLSDEGRLVVVSDYDILANTMYYTTLDIQKEFSGLYMVDLGGEASPPSLMLGYTQMQEQYGYTGFRGFTSVQISPNGRTLCLSTYDDLFMTRKSMSYHIVILYDLISNEVVDPFAHNEVFSLETERFSIVPDKRELEITMGLIPVTAATFAPDGGSLLCVWSEESISILFQITLDNDSFDTTCVHIMETDSWPFSLKWWENDIIQTYSAGDPRSYDSMKLLIPATFERVGE